MIKIATGCHCQGCPFYVNEDWCNALESRPFDRRCPLLDGDITVRLSDTFKEELLNEEIED